jgi:hypothetical protein
MERIEISYIIDDIESRAVLADFWTDMSPEVIASIREKWEGIIAKRLGDRAAVDVRLRRLEAAAKLWTLSDADKIKRIEERIADLEKHVCDGDVFDSIRAAFRGLTGRLELVEKEIQEMNDAADKVIDKLKEDFIIKPKETVLLVEIKQPVMSLVRPIDQHLVVRRLWGSVLVGSRLDGLCYFSCPVGVPTVDGRWWALLHVDGAIVGQMHQPGALTCSKEFPWPSE